MAEGFLNVLKPPGMTSHDIVSFVRRTYGLKKVGHAGTLDPAAAGVLPVAVGRATRFIEYLADADKSYRAELTFGFSTTTGDDTGEVLERKDFVLPSQARIEEVLQSFQGEIEQIPPVYSAIKINGQKACDLARKNQQVEIPARKVFLHKLQLLTMQEASIRFDVDCSKGTYIRTLCIDIGRVLDIPSVMSFLVRTRVGSFSLQHAYTLEELRQRPQQALLPISDVLAHLPSVHLEGKLPADFCNGKKIRLYEEPAQAESIRVYDKDENFLGIAGYDEKHLCLVPMKVLG